MTAKRRFVPAAKYVGRTTVETTVAYWEWCKGKPLKVVFKDGHVMRSDYDGLRQLFAGDAVVEVEMS